MYTTCLSTFFWLVNLFLQLLFGASLSAREMCCVLQCLKFPCSTFPLNYHRFFGTYFCHTHTRLHQLPFTFQFHAYHFLLVKLAQKLISAKFAADRTKFDFPRIQFLQGSTSFFHVFLPLESAVFNKLKNVDINRCSYFFQIF